MKIIIILLSYFWSEQMSAQIGFSTFGDTIYTNYIIKFRIQTLVMSNPEFFNTRLKAYQMDGHPYQKYFFNPQGYLIRAVFASHPKDDGRNTYIYDYDQKNRLTQCEWLIKGHERIFKYSYDEKNRLRREDTYGQLLSLTGYRVYEWQNDTVVFVKSYELQPTKSEGGKTVITYNQRGQVVKEQYFKNFKENKIFEWEIKKIYRADGQIEKYLYQNGNAAIQETTFEYDIQNQLSFIRAGAEQRQLFYAPNGLLMRFECATSGGTSTHQCPAKLFLNYTFCK